MVITESSANRVMKDPEVSAKAKAVWAYLDSREGEHVTLEQIVSDFKESTATLRGAIHELMDTGYLRRERFNMNGHAAYNWYLQ